MASEWIHRPKHRLTPPTSFSQADDSSCHSPRHKSKRREVRKSLIITPSNRSMATPLFAGVQQSNAQANAMVEHDNGFMARIFQDRHSSKPSAAEASSPPQLSATSVNIEDCALQQRVEHLRNPCIDARDQVVRELCSEIEGQNCQLAVGDVSGLGSELDSNLRQEIRDPTFALERLPATQTALVKNVAQAAEQFGRNSRQHVDAFSVAVDVGASKYSCLDGAYDLPVDKLKRTLPLSDVESGLLELVVSETIAGDVSVSSPPLLKLHCLEMMNRALTTPESAPGALEVVERNNVHVLVDEVLGHGEEEKPEVTAAATEFALHLQNSSQGKRLAQTTSNICEMTTATAPIPSVVNVMRRNPRRQTDATDVATLSSEVSSLQQLFQRIANACSKPGTSSAEKVKLLATGCRTVNDLVHKEKATLLIQAEVNQLTLEIAKANRGDPQIQGHCFEILAECANVSPAARVWVMDNCLTAVDPSILSENEKAADSYVEIVEDLCMLNVLQRSTVDLKEVERNLNTLKMAEFADEAGLDLTERIDHVLSQLNRTEGKMTLKDVYGLLVVKNQSQASILVSSVKSVRRLLEYCIQTMDGYTKMELDALDAYGTDYMYGCMCYQLLAEAPENQRVLISRNIHVQLTCCLQRQHNEQIVQHAVITLVDLLQKTEDGSMVAALLANHDLPTLLTSVLRRGRQYTEMDTFDEIEDMVVPRVSLVRLLARDRGVFQGTNILEQLLKTWELYDEYWYGRAPRVNTIEDLNKLSSKQRNAVRKEKMKKRKSILPRGLVFKKANIDKDDVPSPTHNANISPLERRKSVVAAVAMEQVEHGNVTKKDASRLVRRASMASINQPPGLARRQSMTGSVMSAGPGKLEGLKRRMSLIPAPTPAPVEPNKNRASAMQRRGSYVDTGCVQAADKKAKEMGFMDSDDELSGAQTARSGRSFRTTQTSRSRTQNFESTLFVSKMLEAIFGAMRSVVTLGKISYMKSQNVGLRLLGVVVDTQAPPPALPDVLFLLGFLTGDAEQKQDLGNAGAVSRIIDLIKRAYKYNGPCVSEVVANSCLTLASLVVNHLQNIHNFAQCKGNEMIASVLRTRGAMNDARSVNAAAALICNLCFKHESMKKDLGQDGCCEALVEALKNYRGSDSSDGSKSTIASLFKAIGNMALNQHNMERFLESNVEVAFEKFLSSVSVQTDILTMSSCMLTLSNLVIEKDNMQRFENVVCPILSVLRRQTHCNVEVHRWAFETCGHLCRWPPNAKAFTKNDGITTVLSILPYLEDVPVLQSSVVYLLGVQMTDLDNIHLLLDKEVFTFMRKILLNFLKYKEEMLDMPVEKARENIVLNTTLPLSCLRCMGRIFIEKFACMAAYEAGLFDLLVRCLPVVVDQSMVSYEVIRLLLTFIFHWQSDEPARPEVDADKVVKTVYDACQELDWEGWEHVAEGTNPNETVANTPWNRFRIKGCDPPLKKAAHIKPPPGARAWQMLGLTEEKVGSIVRDVRRAVGNPRGHRNYRLQRVGIGALSYFAGEKVATAAFLERLDPPDEVPMIGEDKPAGEPGMQRRKSVVERIFKKDESEKKDTPYIVGDRKPKDSYGVTDIIREALNNVGFDIGLVYSAYHLMDNLTWAALGDEDKTILLADGPLLDVMKVHTMQGEKEELIACARSVRFYSRFLKSGGMVEDEEAALARENMLKQQQDKEEKKSRRHRRSRTKKSDGDVAAEPAPSKSFKTMKSSFAPGGLGKFRLLNVNDLHVMREVAIDNYDLQLSGYFDNPYPDGVQSLSPEARAKLRRGGHAHCVENGEKKILHWRSSHDLLVLEWKTLALKTKDKTIDPNYPYRVAISRLAGIKRGLGTAELQQEAKKDVLISGGNCFAVIGPPLPTHPQGMVLSIVCSTKGKRDEFLSDVTMWREAAAFGFR